ncbi:hypothetical protein GYB61_00135 [bacterium]|nr:hypothetical protein [bacterium]
MHILSKNRHSEFLATPQLIRFDNADGGSEREPSLLVKANSLQLKYIISGVSLKLHFLRLGDRLVYALEVADDIENPLVVWSVVEQDQELFAIRSTHSKGNCKLFLFNDLAINVGWQEVTLDGIRGLSGLTDGIAVGPVDYGSIADDVSTVFDIILAGGNIGVPLITTPIANSKDWHPIDSIFITSHATSSPINLFKDNEGSQQEQLAIWLTDNIDPSGVHASPQVPKGNGTRELTDVLLSHEYGSILIESKALTILGRDNLPTRSNLSKNVESHLKKAMRQLQGAIRKLTSDTPIYSQSGDLIEVERNKPVHAIVLIPDMDLIENRCEYGLNTMRDFASNIGAMLHIVDLKELLRIVQAAEMISERGHSLSPLQAFDSYLMDRFQKSAEADSLLIEILIRFSDS